MSAEFDRAVEALERAVEDPLTVEAEALRRALSAVVRLYAARAELDPELRPLGPDGPAPTPTETLVTVGDLLDAANVEVFELGLWRAMGNVRP